jgi:voltage-gated potassium channel
MHSSPVARIPKPNVIERKMDRYMRSPTSVRLAVAVIVTTTATVAVLGGVLMRLLDHKEYPDIWVALWWAAQTVTTVGYGDVTPKDPTGRIVAAVVMFDGIAFLSITVAAITSTFVARAQAEREAVEEAREDAGVEARLADLARRLDRIETALAKLTDR